MTSTRNDKAIKIDKLKNPDIANPSFRKFYIHDKCIIWSFIRKDVIPNFENTYNLTILCNLHFTIIFNATYSKPSISSNLRTLQIRSSHARLSGSYNTKHCQDNTICLLAKKKNLLCDVTNVYVSHRVSRTSECIFFHGCHNDDIWVNSRR